MIDTLLRDASSLVGEKDPVLAESWASGWLGDVRQAAVDDDRDDSDDAVDAEVGLCRMLAARVHERPSASGVAALHAFARVAPPQAAEELREVLAGAAASLPSPAFIVAPLPVPTRAWTAVDVWGAERMLFVEYAEPDPHTMVAQVLDVGGRVVETLALLLGPDVAQEWAEHRTEDDVPMEPLETPVEVALADLASALEATDQAWPPQDDENYVELRALALARSREHAGPPPSREPLDDATRRRLVESFLARTEPPDTAVAASLAGLFLDFGDAYLFAGPLSWSPIAVLALLEDALPRYAELDERQREALPEVLRGWIRFCLAQTGVPEPWVAPVVDAVDAGMPGFTEAWGSREEESSGLP